MAALREPISAQLTEFLSTEEACRDYGIDVVLAELDRRQDLLPNKRDDNPSEIISLREKYRSRRKLFFFF